MNKIVNKIKLLFRKITLPLRRRDLVIDVGSGGNPHFMADVTTDMYDKGTDRFETIQFKGLFVWSNAEFLPFKSKVFDFSISSHVLEHTPYPEIMIDELSRVSKRGYIETPSAWQELVSPYKMHYSRVTLKENKLLFSIKNSYDEKIPFEWEDIYYSLKQIQSFHQENITPLGVNMYLWKDNIKYEVIRKENYTPFSPDEEVKDAVEDSKIKKFFYSTLRLICHKNKKLNEFEILCCPKCKSDLSFFETDAKCTNTDCNSTYIKYKGYWDFRV